MYEVNDDPVLSWLLKLKESGKRREGGKKEKTVVKYRRERNKMDEGREKEKISKRTGS